MNRAGQVFYKDQQAGIISENDEGYRFAYDATYLVQDLPPISLTMPLTASVYKSKILFPFFDGLIPEGWLLTIATQSWKLNPRDRMGLLLTVCQDCLGAVSIKKIDEI